MTLQSDLIMAHGSPAPSYNPSEAGDRYVLGQAFVRGSCESNFLSCDEIQTCSCAEPTRRLRGASWGWVLSNWTQSMSLLLQSLLYPSMM